MLNIFDGILASPSVDFLRKFHLNTFLSVQADGRLLFPQKAALRHGGPVHIRFILWPGKCIDK